MQTLHCGLRRWEHKACTCTQLAKNSNKRLIGYIANLRKIKFLNYTQSWVKLWLYKPVDLKSLSSQLKKVRRQKNLESPSPKDALCQVWLKLVQRFWRRRFLNVVIVFLLCRIYLPLVKSVHGPSFPETWNSFTWICFVISLIEIGPVLLEKKNVKN